MNLERLPKGDVNRNDLNSVRIRWSIILSLALKQIETIIKTVVNKIYKISIQ